MKKLIFKKHMFDVGYIFYFKFNRNIVLRATREGCYILDLDFDPEFSKDTTEVLFISWSSLEQELQDNKSFFYESNGTD